MKRVLILVALCLGCATTPSKPTGRHTAAELKKATLELHQGMPAAEVERLLGPPDSAEASICGQLYGTGWKCTSWEYLATDNEVMNNLRLRFQGDSGALILNSWGKF
jgi:hypothetical protein